MHENTTQTFFIKGFVQDLWPQTIKGTHRQQKAKQPSVFQEVPSVVQIAFAEQQEVQRHEVIVTAADQAKADWVAKVRIVVCGNYEHGTSGSAPDNSSTNLAIESLRALLSRAAREPTWLAGSLDISCAFLNVWLPERHKVLVKPPAAAVKTGHFHEDELL